jgi:hypothetical protein
VYISSNYGSDGGNGTSENPFATIQMGTWAIASGYNLYIDSGYYSGFFDTCGKVLCSLCNKKNFKRI